MLIKDTLINCDDYACAYNKLRSEDIASLGYITLAGVKDNEGVVITRENFNTVHENHLDYENNDWFLVQTNNDHWLDNGC